VVALIKMVTEYPAVARTALITDRDQGKEELEDSG
tara:strand:+ start:85 stop:189 length:105 start_codon:yes stop_codon:yes gene_type:complete